MMQSHLGYGARVTLIFLASALASACADSADRLSAPNARQLGLNASPADVRAAIAAQERSTPALMAVPGVVGTAVGLASDGRAVIQVLLAAPNVADLPLVVDGIPVVRIVTGVFYARSNPTLRARPAPIGYSIGHPLVTAGTLGAVVLDLSGNYFVLSNNHVLANSNGASVGDAALQPGTYDGGTNPADRIGTLYDFQTINFSGGNNLIDAAIALVNRDSVSNSSPTDDGYGVPSAQLFNDANDDRVFDDITALLNLPVQKYGRTTKLTHGTISGINGVVDVCYEVVLIFCSKSAHYVDQLLITPGAFSGGGDSGSMIVTDDAIRNPVALLFAGSSTQTIGNRMDNVLRRFNVRIDGTGGAPPPPPPSTTDLSITTVSAPASAVQGDVVSISVTVKNVGTQDVASDVNLTLTDNVDGQLIGTATVSGGLTAGATATRSFSWNTDGEATGYHTLTAQHDFADDVATNNSGSASVNITLPAVGGLHFGDLDGFSITQSGGKWLARVILTAHGPNHELLAGAQAGGIWSDGVEFTCTTNFAGSCLAEHSMRKQLQSITFTVAGIVYGLTPFTPEQNHDPDGDSDGTQITVRKP